MTLTIFVSADTVRRTPWAVSRCCETQHRSEVLCELLQSSNVTSMHAVLKIWPHCHHGHVLLMAWFPGQQLGKITEKMKKESENKEIRGHNVHLNPLGENANMCCAAVTEALLR